MPAKWSKFSSFYETFFRVDARFCRFVAIFCINGISRQHMEVVLFRFYKILSADVYLNASCSTGNAHISTIWGLTAQKSPCNPQENSAGHRGHFQRFIEGYGITGPVYQALGPLSYSRATLAPRQGALIACQPEGRAARQSRSANARPSCHIYDARGSSP